MRANQRIAESLAVSVKAWRGSVQDFGDDYLLAEMPSERTRDAFIDQWSGGVGSTGVLVQKASEPTRLIFRWKARRG